MTTLNRALLQGLPESLQTMIQGLAMIPVLEEASLRHHKRALAPVLADLKAVAEESERYHPDGIHSCWMDQNNGDGWLTLEEEEITTMGGLITELLDAWKEENEE